MCFRRVIVLIFISLFTWTDITAGGGDQSTWSIRQQDGGLDELFSQTLSAAPATPDYEFIPTICNAIKTTDSFRKLTQDNGGFRSDIRGHLTKVENPPLYVTEFGSRRYELKRDNLVESLPLDLYPCADDHPSKVYLLSYGYEKDSLFFVFALDVKTNEAELKALVQGQPDDSPETNIYDETPSIASELKQMVKHDFPRNPLCDLSQVQRVKACLLLLNTPYYTNRFMLAPTWANHDPQCKRITSESGVDEYGLPCWIRPVSNPWIKVLFLPNELSVPVYISVDYGSFSVKTYKTVRQDDKVDTVKFDANFIDLFVKDFFFIFKEAAAKVKQVSEFMKERRNSGRAEVADEPSNNDAESLVVTTNKVDVDIAVDGASVHGN